jgi:hypothetical protein
VAKVLIGRRLSIGMKLKFSRSLKPAVGEGFYEVLAEILCSKGFRLKQPTIKDSKDMNI